MSYVTILKRLGWGLSFALLAALFGGNRADAGELIPACGLCLMEVTY